MAVQSTPKDVDVDSAGAGDFGSPDNGRIAVRFSEKVDVCVRADATNDLELSKFGT